MSFSFSRDRIEELKNTEPLQNNSDEFGPPRRPGQYQRTHSKPQIEVEVEEEDEKRELITEKKMEEGHHDLISIHDTVTMEGFFKYIDGLKSDLNDISSMINLVDELHIAILSSFNEQKYRQVADQLELNKCQIRNKNQYLKQHIQELDTMNSQLSKDLDTEMRKTQTNALRKRFLDSIQRYQDVERSYQSKYRQQMERQVRIVKPDVSQEEIEDLIDSDEPTQIFAQSLIGNKHAQAKAVLSEVQTRHGDIKHIEKTIIELHQLFMDMSMMVEQQGRQLEKVESFSSVAKVNLEQGRTFLTKAIKSAKATRAKKWCCFFICIVICIMIGLLVWWYGFGHTGSYTQA